ncbi:MAG TPA: anthranilate phosphoribosyltransferase [Caulobacterales bacterium]|nr:anthranilate phosphoribosyltransferase [Caulobacterales bacterium]
MSDLDAGFARVLDGETTPEETKAFLLNSIERMGDPAAIAAGARAMRARMLTLSAPDGAIDVCGTGGDGSHTLNISTAVAFVVAGAGVPVAKHGNRAMSSKCGAADVLEALGVKLTGDIPSLERALREAGVAFLFAQNHHPAMRHVAAARREIGRRTIFNLLGPLSNPAGVKRQLVGVFAPDFLMPVARALNDLGAQRAIVLHGAGGFDELTGDRGDQWVDLDAGAIGPARLDVHGADDSGVSRAALRGGSAADNARALRALLDGSSDNGVYRHVVELNAAMALNVAGLPAEQAMTLPRESLEGGAALDALDKLIAITRDAP